MGIQASALPGASPWNRGLPQERELGDHTPPSPLETAPTSVGVAAGNLAPSKRGLKRGLKDRSRTVLLMLDETIVTETPPLYSCYGPIGEQVRVPISPEFQTRFSLTY